MPPFRLLKPVLGVALLSILTLFACPASVQAQATTELVSHISAGTDGNVQSFASTVSANGRFVVFMSEHLAGIFQIYVYDRQTQAAEMVSVTPSGAPGDDNSTLPSLSADGRYVVFVSSATNLVVGDTNNAADVFVRDRQTHTTERVSISTSSVQSNDPGITPVPAISADGRYVAFHSGADNLVAGDTNNAPDIFVRDRQNHTTERVSVNSNGVQGNDTSYICGISSNGQFVAFTSHANNLVPDDTNARQDIFVHNRATRTTERVSINSSGAQANSFSDGGGISPDGRYVVFASFASNLVPGDTNGKWDMFVHDRQTHITERISVSTAGVQGNANSNFISQNTISADGRYVTFGSEATNLVSGTSPVRVPLIYVHDRILHKTTCVSVSYTEQLPDGTGYGGTISADGNYIVFSSDATNLVPGVTKGTSQIYIRGPLLSTATVSGTITLESIVPNAAAQSFTLTFKPADNSGNVVRNASVGPNGTFSASDLPRKSYTLHIKGAKYLASNVAVNITNGNVSGVTAFLKAGDANADNAVDVLDLDVLIQSFDADASASNWNGGSADFNGDGSVDVFDLALLIQNFDAVGDP